MNERPQLVEQLLVALQDTRPGVRHYLDRSTGRLVSRSRGPSDEREDADETLLPVPSVGPDHAFETMRLFIASVRNPSLRDRLQLAAQGRGAFRRFREVLAQHPRELQGWLSFRDLKLRERLSSWLASHGLRTDTLGIPDASRAMVDAQVRLEELTLLLAYLSSWEEDRGPNTRVRRAWKGYRFEVLEKLQAQGLLKQGRSSKSLLLTAEGVARARQVEASLGLDGAAPSDTIVPSPRSRRSRRPSPRPNGPRRTSR